MPAKGVFTKYSFTASANGFSFITCIKISWFHVNDGLKRDFFQHQHHQIQLTIQKTHIIHWIDRSCGRNEDDANDILWTTYGRVCHWHFHESQPWLDLDRRQCWNSLERLLERKATTQQPFFSRNRMKHSSWRKTWKMNALSKNHTQQRKNTQGKRLSLLLLPYRFHLLVRFAGISVLVNFDGKNIFPISFRLVFIDFCIEIANGLTANAQTLMPFAFFSALKWTGVRFWWLKVRLYFSSFANECVWTLGLKWTNKRSASSSELPVDRSTDRQATQNQVGPKSQTINFKFKLIWLALFGVLFSGLSGQ